MEDTEKDLLQKLNIPSLNPSIETLGCPKYDVLRTQFLNDSLLPSCGFYQDDKVHVRRRMSCFLEGVNNINVLNFYFHVSFCVIIESLNFERCGEFRKKPRKKIKID